MDMNTKLVTKADIKKAIKIRGLAGNIIATIAMPLIGINRVNKLYSKSSGCYGRDFSSSLLRELNIKYEIPPKELEYIPQEGPFIVVSNHPYGAIDGVILIDIFSAARPDIKFLTNFILSHIPNLKEFFFPVNPFTDKPELAQSFSGLRMAAESIKGGGALSLFPAGEVATTYGSSIIQDKEWQPSIIKLIRNAGVQVLPVYVHGTNSRFFHWLGKLHPMLRTVRLPGELLNKKNHTIQVRIGKPITIAELSEYKDLKQLGGYLRSRTYALEGNVQSKIIHPEDVYSTPIALPKNRRALIKEINSLPKEKHLFTTGNYSCYLTDSRSIPLAMHELGRKREEAFRAVGEGTKSPLDIDSYDDYYQHLFLWDKQKGKIVGAYRLGYGDEILKTKGIKGFYTKTLFDYNPEFHSYLNKSIELGRSFVTLEYQKEALPLMLLIKGLLYSVLNKPDVRYLIGPVSISSWYPKFYRSLMIEYLKRHHSVKELEKMMKPKNPFFPNFHRCNPDILLSGSRTDSIEKFDRYMLKLSDGEFRLPTLVKKYLKINASIINFNVDPDFNYCLDGLVFMDIFNVPEQEIRMLARDEKNIGTVLKRFGMDKKSE
jgi:putative hemolysin